jgi:glutaredoxin
MELDYTQDLIPQLEWHYEEISVDNNQKSTIYLIGLSTCAYCKRGKAWLKERGLNYSWLFLDKIDIDERQRIKTTLSQIYNTKFNFPFIIFRLPDQDFVSSGFDPDYWKSKI